MSSASRILLAAVAVCLLAAAPLQAQDRIPPNVINATSVLASDQQQQLDAYIANWVGQMVNGNDEQVVKARDKLSDPFNVGGTRIFTSAYSSKLGLDLQQGLASERLIVRLNTMMVVGKMSPGDAVTLVEKGLEDGNSAIRYAAARAANELATRNEGKAPAAIQQRLLAGMTKQLNSERVQIVLEQLLLGISSLEITEASELLLAGLNRRVDLHAAEPNTPVSADREAMARLYRRYVLTPPENNEVVRSLAQVAFRHLDLSVKLLKEGKLSEAAAGERQSMIVLADQILHWFAEKQLGKDVRLPQPIEGVLSDLQMARLSVAEWRKLLTSAPANFRPDQLNLPE